MGLNLKAGVRAVVIPVSNASSRCRPRYEDDHEITCDPGRAPRDNQNTNVK